MKCPNCGAEIANNQQCEFCGSKITPMMRQEIEQMNKAGCPKCGSGNVTFRRENQAVVNSKSSKEIINRTVGLCNDCGATWYTDSAPEKKRKTWLWVLGWIFIFPVPLTIILVKKKDMKPILKYGLIALAWIVYLAIGFSGNTESTTTPASNSSEVVSNQNIQETESEKQSELSEIITTTKDSVPAEYKSALKKAQLYSDTMYMSKEGLYDQLTSQYGEQFSKEAAEYAVENVNADFNENALRKAKLYQNDMAMSPAAIHDQLTSAYGEKFTQEEADYAIAHLND